MTFKGRLMINVAITAFCFGLIVAVIVIPWTVSLGPDHRHDAGPTSGPQLGRIEGVGDREYRTEDHMDGEHGKQDAPPSTGCCERQEQ